MSVGKEKEVNRGRAMQKIEIRVKGQIDRSWSDWFGGLTINHTPRGETVLAGPIRDQSQLRGMLFRLADLGLELTSVKTRMETHCNMKKGGD